MKYFLILISSLFILQACSNEEAPMDTETNKYYADYLALHAAYDSLGNEGTLDLLNKYISEYPERKEAYVFKGYILAEMGALADADLIFEEAIQKDSTNITIYEYRAAYLLYDSSQLEKAANVLTKGLMVSDSSVSLYNSQAWLHLFQGEYLKALESVNKGNSLDPNYINIYRPGFIAAHYLKDDELRAYFQSMLENSNIESSEILNTLNSGTSYSVYKNIP